MDRIWVSEEAAKEIGMQTNWFGVLEKPKLAINRFNRILLLDNFHSSGELGTLIRSARCFGFDGILLTGGSVSLWDISVSRSAQDNLLALPVVSLPFSDAIRLLREQQVSLVTIGKRKAVPAEELPLSDRMAILIPGSGNSSAYLVAASDIVCDPVLDCVDTAKLITLNPNRIYCFFKKKGGTTVRFSGVPLDQRFWNNDVSSRGAHPNEVDEKTFTASAVKFNRTPYNNPNMNRITDNNIDEYLN